MPVLDYSAKPYLLPGDMVRQVVATLAIENMHISNSDKLKLISVADREVSVQDAIAALDRIYG